MSTDELDNSYLLRTERLEQLDHTPVQVIWQDAYSGLDSWHHLTDIRNEPRIIRSVGILLHGKVDDHISVCQSFDNGHVDHVLHIPIKMVKQVDRLRVRR